MTSPEEDLHQPEAAADDTAVPEELADFSGAGVGSQIKVFGPLAQQEIPNAPPYQISGITGMMEAVKHLQGFHLNVFPGDIVFRPGNDAGRSGRRFRDMGPHDQIIREIS
jgi:hypothetical protein